MPNSPAIAAAALDAVLSLHEAEQGSVFRLMGEDSPYVANAPPAVRDPLRELHDVNARHIGELAALIVQLGGAPRARPAIADPYLKYLSMKFLVPRLLTEKELMLERYENTLRALRKVAPDDVIGLLNRQRDEQAASVDTLSAVAAREPIPDVA